MLAAKSREPFLIKGAEPLGDRVAACESTIGAVFARQAHDGGDGDGMGKWGKSFLGTNHDNDQGEGKHPHPGGGPFLDGKGVYSFSYTFAIVDNKGFC